MPAGGRLGGPGPRSCGPRPGAKGPGGAPRGASLSPPAPDRRGLRGPLPASQSRGRTGRTQLRRRPKPASQSRGGAAARAPWAPVAIGPHLEAPGIPLAACFLAGGLSCHACFIAWGGPPPGAWGPCLRAVRRAGGAGGPWPPRLLPSVASQGRPRALQPAGGAGRARAPRQAPPACSRSRPPPASHACRLAGAWLPA